MTAGRFVTFEGGEGAGKSTQLAALAASLRERGLTVTTTREPGGSPGAESIRRLLVEGDPGRWDAMGEALLHSAARRDHLVRTVWPALEAGQWVLSDRFADSTLAYQGYGHGVPLERLEALYALVAGDFAPDLTLLLDIPVAEGLRRAGRRGGAEDRYERMEASFHERLRRGFLAIAAAHPGRFLVIDASANPEQVARAILAGVIERLAPP